VAVPWLRILNGVIGVTDIVRTVRGRSEAEDPDQLAMGARGPAALEARLAGVVVAALKEAFDRDHQRMELERHQIDSERERAERMLRLEMLRQAGDREIGRLRLLAGVAVASWLGTLFFATQLIGGPSSSRISLGLGWLLLLAALAASFAAQTSIGRALGRIDDPAANVDTLTRSGAGSVAPWLIVAGLATIAFGVLLV
jgi:hypothetical protein